MGCTHEYLIRFPITTGTLKGLCKIDMDLGLIVSIVYKWIDKVDKNKEKANQILKELIIDLCRAVLNLTLDVEQDTFQRGIWLEECFEKIRENKRVFITTDMLKSLIKQDPKCDMSKVRSKINKVLVCLNNYGEKTDLALGELVRSLCRVVLYLVSNIEWAVFRREIERVENFKKVKGTRKATRCEGYQAPALDEDEPDIYPTTKQRPSA